MEDILIASLGESPIVVTAMYRLLKEQKNIDIKQVVVLRPEGKLLADAVLLIQNALYAQCEVIDERLPFEDADTVEHSFTFLQTLYRILDTAQKSGQSVYLSLAGGRKNMSAIMALLAPLFPCVKGLYHVLDKEEGSPQRAHFKPIEDILGFSDDDCRAFFFPKLNQLTLVEIPYSREQQVSDEFRSRLFTMTKEHLAALWETDPAQAEIVQFYQSIVLDTPVIRRLKIRLTLRAKEEYKRMLRHDATRAKRYAKCFEQMKDPYHLKEKIHGSGFNRGSLSFHFFKRDDTGERPFYHTEPEGIHFFPKAKVETVIISGFALEQKDGSYKPTGEQLLQAFDPTEDTVPLEDVLAPAGCILVVPLGTSPMIATQLYTLLKRQGHTIRQVVLVYPAQAREIKNGADLLKLAFADEDKNVDLLEYKVPGYADIDSKDACLAYERTLDQAIDAARSQHPDCPLVLSLSGGRKGMAALAMFVAQRKGIHFVYHTLITDKELSKRVERETSIDALRSTLVNPEVRNKRLFLRAYEGDGPSTAFTLFKVPVLPARG